MYHEFEIRKQLEGRNPDGSYKSACLAETFLCSDLENPEGNIRKISNDENSFAADVYFNFQDHDGYMQIDMHFNSPDSPELERIWKSLESYGTLMDSCAGKEEQPIYKLTILPQGNEHEEVVMKGWVEAFLPLFWAIQPSVLTERVDTIRVLYETSNFLYKENSAYYDNLQQGSAGYAEEDDYE